MTLKFIDRTHTFTQEEIAQLLSFENDERIKEVKILNETVTIITTTESPREQRTTRVSTSGVGYGR